MRRLTNVLYQRESVNKIMNYNLSQVRQSYKETLKSILPKANASDELLTLRDPVAIKI